MKKIFGIGLPKTGQTSLASAMISLGYKTVQYPYKSIQITKNDFALDLPVTINYKKLDKQYPGSKFIMTIRDHDSWLKSMRNHYRRYPASTRYQEQLDFRQKFWGTIYFSQKIMTKRYYEYHEDVAKYFSKRNKDLLIINIVGGEGWEKLCQFLGKKIPKRSFPIVNVGKYRNS